MKRIIIGDTHGRSFWKLIANTEEWDELIFIGDYFDTHDDISGLEQLHNFNEIINFKKASDKPVILLIGNHDHHYFPEIGYTGTSGYQSGIAKNFEATLQREREHLQMAYAFDNVLCSHAGVGEAWMERLVKYKIVEKLPNFTTKEIAEFVNEIWYNKPRVFEFTGNDSTGDDMGQTPIWIRPRSLYKDSRTMNKEGIIQIVGHTQVKAIDIEACTKIGIFTIDALGTSGEYLIYDGEKFTKNTIKN